MTVCSDRRIELSQLAFHCREAGDPDAPPLVLLHGLMYDAQDWDEIAGGWGRVAQTPLSLARTWS